MELDLELDLVSDLPDTRAEVPSRRPTVGVGEDALAPEALPGLSGTPRLLWATPPPGL